MRIPGKTGQVLILALGQIVANIVHLNTFFLNQIVGIRLLDFSNQFSGPKIAATVGKLGPGVGRLALQLSMKQTREVAYDLFAALCPDGHKAYESVERRCTRPFVRFLVLNNRLDPFQVAAAYGSQDSPERVSHEIPVKIVKKFTRKKRHTHYKRVSASLAELSQQVHGVEMGHVPSIVGKLLRAVDCLFQYAEKSKRDLFPLNSIRFESGFHSGPSKLSCMSFKLPQNFRAFHRPFR